MNKILFITFLTIFTLNAFGQSPEPWISHVAFQQPDVDEYILALVGAIDGNADEYTLSGNNLLAPAELIDSIDDVWYVGEANNDAEWQESGNFGASGSDSTKYMNLTYGYLLKLRNLSAAYTPPDTYANQNVLNYSFINSQDIAVEIGEEYILSLHYKIEPNYYLPIESLRAQNDNSWTVEDIAEAFLGVKIYDGGVLVDTVKFLTSTDFENDNVAKNEFVSKTIKFTPTASSINIQLISTNSYRKHDGTVIDSEIYACAAFFDDVSLYAVGSEEKTINDIVSELTQKIAVIEQHELQYGKLRGINTYSEWLRPELAGTAGFMEVSKWPSLILVDEALGNTFIGELFFTTALESVQSRVIPLVADLTGFETNLSFIAAANYTDVYNTSSNLVEYWGMFNDDGSISKPTSALSTGAVSFTASASYTPFDTVSINVPIGITRARSKGLFTFTTYGRRPAGGADPWQCAILSKRFEYVK